MIRLSIKINQDEIVLHGEGTTSPIQGCVRQPTQFLSSGHCLEKLDLVLQGSQSQLRVVITRLQTLLERIRLGHDVWLLLTPDHTSEPYQSRLVGGSFGWILNSIKPKGIGIRLELERQDYWQLPWRSLALSNVHGSALEDGIQIDNRCDSQSGKQNWCWLAGEALLGDLPAPIRVRVRHDIGLPQNIDRVMIGLNAGRTAPLAVLEGEQADSTLNFGSVMDPDCHAGAYGLVQWNSTNALKILSWMLPGSQFQGLAGRQLRPLVRLINPLSMKEGTWISWKLFHGGLVYQSGSYELTIDRALQLLPAIQLPRLHGSQDSWADLRLEMHAQNRLAGSTELAIDCIFLFFTDGWRQFIAAQGGRLAFGEELIDQGDLSQPYIHITHTASDQHAFQAHGNGLWLVPGEDHLVQLLWDIGLEMPMDMSCHLRLEYQPRTRMLT